MVSKRLWELQSEQFGLMYPHIQVHSKISVNMISAFITFTAILPCIPILELNLRDIQAQSLTSKWSTVPQLPPSENHSPFPAANRLFLLLFSTHSRLHSTNIFRFLSSVPGARWHFLRFIMIVFHNSRNVSPLKTSALCWFSKLTRT